MNDEDDYDTAIKLARLLLEREDLYAITERRLQESLKSPAPAPEPSADVAVEEPESIAPEQPENEPVRAPATSPEPARRGVLRPQVSSLLAGANAVVEPSRSPRRSFSMTRSRQAGADVVRAAMEEMQRVIGDGKARAALVAGALIAGICEGRLPEAGPSKLSRELAAALPILQDLLRGLAVELQSKEQIASLVRTAGADDTVGELIAEAMDKVGRDGVLTVEENNTFGLDLVEFTEGMRFDKGYISPYFADGEGDERCVLDDPYLLIVNSTSNHSFP